MTVSKLELIVLCDRPESNLTPNLVQPPIFAGKKTQRTSDAGKYRLRAAGLGTGQRWEPLSTLHPLPLHDRRPSFLFPGTETSDLVPSCNSSCHVLGVVTPHLDIIFKIIYVCYH